MSEELEHNPDEMSIVVDKHDIFIGYRYRAELDRDNSCDWRTSNAVYRRAVAVFPFNKDGGGWIAEIPSRGPFAGRVKPLTEHVSKGKNSYRVTAAACVREELFHGSADPWFPKEGKPATLNQRSLRYSGLRGRMIAPRLADGIVLPVKMDSEVWPCYMVAFYALPMSAEAIGKIRHNPEESRELVSVGLDELFDQRFFGVQKQVFSEDDAIFLQLKDYLEKVADGRIRPSLRRYPEPERQGAFYWENQPVRQRGVNPERD